MRENVRSVGAGNDAGTPRDGGLDIRALGRALWARRWWVLAPALAVAVLASIVVNLMTPRYKSEARILIEGRENVFLHPEAEKPGERDRALVDQEAVTSQVRLALSRDLARQVIRQLKLGERPEFDPTLHGISPVVYALRVLGIGKDPLQMTAEERVLESYDDRLSVVQAEKSRVIAIEFASADPELAATAANAIADGYLALHQTAKQEEMSAAGRWLAGEIENLRHKVAEAEARVEEFRAKSNLFIGADNTALPNQQLAEANSQLAAARSRQAESANGQDVQLWAMEREAKLQHDLLESYLAKYRETTARDSPGAIPAETRIISRAAVSNTPFFPMKLPIVLIASLAVLFIVAGSITARELLVGNPHRMLSLQGSAAADGPVPEPGSELAGKGGPPPPAAAAAAPSVVAAAAIAGVPAERLLADLAAQLRRGDRRRILVAGADREIGSTMAALALARVLAREARVVVVDLALAAPKLAALSVDPGGPGLADLVRGTASFARIITRDHSSRVHLVPAGRIRDEASAILDSERLRMGIEVLTQAYDHVVIDAGPVPDMQVARMAELASTAVLVATAVPEDVTATAKARLAAGGVSDVTVLAGPPLQSGSDAHPAAA